MSVKENKNDEKSETGKLTLKQAKFCELYVDGTKDFFGNGVECYLEVYDIDKSKPNWYKAACACASRLLSNAKVIDKISNLLEEGGLNDVFVDKQLKFLLTQYADFGSKLGAIKEYNKLKQRITDKIDLTSKGKALPVLVKFINGEQNNNNKHTG
jgi:hypothetical protein